MAVDHGPSKAKDPRNMLARVHAMLFSTLEDDDARSRVGWMPSHLLEAELGEVKKSDGSLVNTRDLQGNTLADQLAKRAVEYHRVAASDVAIWKEQMKVAESRAKWVGISTHAANNFESFPFKDSEAARWRADAAKRARSNAKTGTDGRRKRGNKLKDEIAVEQGGHHLIPLASGKGWFCLQCKARTKVREKLATSKCEGVSTKQWAVTETKMMQNESTWGTAEGRRHIGLKSGSITWCGSCGCFAETRANGLSGECNGPPPKEQGSGGRRAQLNKLRSGLHPVTGARLPAVRMLDGKAVDGEGTYQRRQGNKDDAKQVTDERFYRYEPAALPVAKPSYHGATATMKADLRMVRVKLKEKELKKRRLQLEVAEVITSFVENAAAVTAPAMAASTEDDDDESKRFWSELVTVENPHTADRDIFKGVVSCQPAYGPRGTSQRQSRSLRLNTSKDAGLSN